MKILFDLQLSFIDKELNLFKVRHDSNFNFTINAIKGLKELDSSIEIGLIIPNHLDIENYYELISEIKWLNNIFYAKYQFNIITSRFVFPFEDFKAAIKSFKPDYVWTNDFSRVSIYKCIANELNYKYKIIAYNHWIDNFLYPRVSDEYTYFFGQVDGGFKADYLVFNSPKGIEMYIDGVSQIYNSEFVTKLLQKCYYAYPAFDFTILDNLENTDKFKNNTVLFNHRLSSLPYYKSNFEYFKRLCDKYHDKYKFDVILTNPSGYSQKDFPEYMKLMNIPNYEEYLSLIKNCSFCVGLFFDSPGTWSMSLAEAASVGVPLLLPNKSGYKEIVPPKYDFLVDSYKDAEEKFELLLNLNDNDRSIISSKLIEYSQDSYSPKNAIKKLYEVIK